jgi:hypothetical protein
MLRACLPAALIAVWPLFVVGVIGLRRGSQTPRDLGCEVARVAEAVRVRAVGHLNHE